MFIPHRCFRKSSNRGADEGQGLYRFQKMQIYFRYVKVAEIDVMAAARLDEIILYHPESFQRLDVTSLQKHQIRLVVTRLHEQLLHVQSRAYLFTKVIHLS